MDKVSQSHFSAVRHVMEKWGKKVGRIKGKWKFELTIFELTGFNLYFIPFKAGNNNTRVVFKWNDRLVVSNFSTLVFRYIQFKCNCFGAITIQSTICKDI